MYDELLPLRIHHFLLWMTITAVLISGCMSFDRMVRNGPPIENRTIVASLTVFAIVISGAWTFTGMGIARRERGYRFPASPGEWLTWLLATSGLAFIAVFAGVFLAFAFNLLVVYYGVVGLVLLYNWASWIRRGYRTFGDTRTWKISIALIGTMPFSSLLFQSEWPFAYIAMSLVVAAITDVWRHTSRSWTHWLGVSLMLTFTLAFYSLVAQLP